MNVGALIKYLKVHASPRSVAHSTSRKREQYLAFLSEAILEAAKILIEQREPWMLTEWRFDVIANQTTYKLYLDIAIGGQIGEIENFGIINSLFVLDKAGADWVSYRLRPKIEALTDAQPTSGNNTFARRSAHLELVPGHAGVETTEADYALILENPPDYTSLNGGRLSLFVLPSELPDDVLDTFQPALPPYAWTWVKRHALMLMYLADGNDKAYQALYNESEKAEVRLRAGLGSGISDEPDYVTDVAADEAEFFP